MLEEIIRTGIVMPAPEPEPALPPTVPPRNNRDSTAVSEANKNLWDYMGSATLLEAVEGGIVSQIEAEVVMEIASYRRSVNYTALAVGISTERVIELYQAGIRKLRRWLSR
ncbi:MAG: hypothetical protein V1709_09990 [Planctomycetota bacterium]